MPDCPHTTDRLTYDRDADLVRCACGAVFVPRAAVHERNAKVAQAVLRSMGTLVGGIDGWQGNRQTVTFDTRQKETT